MVKLDMGKAWTDASGILAANFGTIATIAGLFLFLPYFAMAIFLPETINPEQPDIPPGADPDLVMNATMEALTKQYSDNWPAFLIVSLIQFFGTLSLLALLTDRAKPTVGEALKQGARGVLSYLASQLLVALLAGLVIGLPIGLAAGLGQPVIGGLLAVIGFVLIIYFFIKFTFTAAVIAIEDQLNPITALRRSWSLTKGNSFRIAIFLVLLFLLIGIVSLLVQSALGLVFSAFGGSFAAIGNGFVTALINGGIGALFATIIVGMYRQLSASTPDVVAREFE